MRSKGFALTNVSHACVPMPYLPSEKRSSNFTDVNSTTKRCAVELGKPLRRAISEAPNLAFSASKQCNTRIVRCNTVSPDEELAMPKV
ncbi:hypothetical protein C627_12945 [Corynebacterium glutamicum ZL-6]|nr:hypothetical protein C628_13070 [[Brevibacterium] flavum ZL-1]ANR66517.1 hypothetical protein C627_12945 [Corynebacterium glutamicum ZL-6]PST74823.1 hypothetical protein I919_13132 [Corynebacterium glutamicum ZL-2]